jgi:hypothetical protein
MLHGVRRFMDWDNIQLGVSKADVYNSQLFTKNWKTRPSVFRAAFELYLMTSYREQILLRVKWHEPITVAARSKVLTVFARLNTRVVGSNPTRGMDVCVRLFCVYVVLCAGSGLATDWSPFQGVQPAVYRIKKLKKQPRSNGLYNHRERERDYMR